MLSVARPQSGGEEKKREDHRHRGDRPGLGQEADRRRCAHDRRVAQERRHAQARQALADKTGLAATQILEWVNRADLYRIKGVGSEYSDLLEKAGVDTVVELANRNAANLAKAIKDLVGKGTRIVRRIPSDREIASWITQAKSLPRAVEY